MTQDDCALRDLLVCDNINCGTFEGDRANSKDNLNGHSLVQGLSLSR